MGSTEQIRSTEWVALKHEGEEVAEAWLMPEGDRVTAVFLVPRERLEAADASQPVTVETLLKAAAVSTDEVESWRLGDGSRSGVGGADPGMGLPLPPPPDEDRLTIYVLLKPPAQAAVGGESLVQEIPPEKWQALDALWKSVLGLEAGIDTSRIGMEGLQSEMEASFRRPLSAEEKLHALQSDVAQWNKAKSRVHYELPKAREFIHRATWAQTLPERKELGEVVEGHVGPRKPLADVDRVREQMEHLQKARQALFSQGAAVGQQCRAALADLQRALSTLQRNAADRARQKRSAGREKGKHF